MKNLNQLNKDLAIDIKKLKENMDKGNTCHQNSSTVSKE